MRRNVDRSFFAETIRRTLIASVMLWVVPVMADPVLTGRAPVDETQPTRSDRISLASQVLDLRRGPPTPAKGLDVFSSEPGAEEIILVKFPGPVSAAQFFFID